MCLFDPAGDRKAKASRLRCEMAAARMLLARYHDGHVGAWPLWLVVLACVLVVMAIFAICLCCCCGCCKCHARGGERRSSYDWCCVCWGCDDDCGCDCYGDCDVGCCCEIC